MRNDQTNKPDYSRDETTAAINKREQREANITN